MAASWFIKRNDKSIGPLSAQQLRELAVAGKLLRDDLVRKDDDGQFTPASGIKSLFGDDTNHSRPVPPPPRLPSPVMSGWHEWISQIQNRWIATRILKVGIAVTAIVVLIALLLPAVQYARDAARKAQAERQIEKSRDGSATPPRHKTEPEIVKKSEHPNDDTTYQVLALTAVGTLKQMEYPDTDAVAFNNMMRLAAKELGMGNVPHTKKWMMVEKTDSENWDFEGKPMLTVYYGFNVKITFMYVARKGMMNFAHADIAGKQYGPLVLQ